MGICIGGIMKLEQMQRGKQGFNFCSSVYCNLYNITGGYGIIFATVFMHGFDVPETEMLNYTGLLLVITIILMSVFSVIYSTISIKLMQKKLNLE